MTDYSKIDWSKLPELPDGLKCRLLVNELQVLKNGYVNAKHLDHDGSEWRYSCELQRHIETAFVATKIIDRFIAEQETELAKPKPRRVTPEELLVELIRTRKAVRVPVETINGKPTPTHIRWTDAGLFGTWPDGSDGDVSMRWFLCHVALEVTDAPIDPFYSSRLPVKTKARRVTVNQLLVELIQTLATIRVRPAETKLSVEYRWTAEGRLLHRNDSNDRWQEYPVSCLFQFEAYEVAESPKPRLPVKTKAPEGARWKIDDGDLVIERDGFMYRVYPSCRVEADVLEAMALAYRELNP